MNKKIIYIEKVLIKHEGVESIIQKIKPSTIEWIDHYKDVLNQRGGHWRVQKRYQSLILAYRSDTFYYEASPLTHSIDFHHFFYNTLSLNCLYDCEYCYLQGMFNTPHLVMFLNNRDYILAADELSRRLHQPFYLALSYDTDLPAIEHLYPYCSQWMEYAKSNPNITIEIRTKSSRTSYFENKTPLKNVVLSWSLSPEDIAQKHEPLTPAPAQRIQAALQAHRMGWPVMLCIDPVIYHKDFIPMYKNLIRALSSSFDTGRIFGISIGTLRMNAQYLANIRKQRLDSELLWFPFERQNGHAFYPKSIRNTILETIKNLLTDAGFKRIFIYE
ncbi:MAG: radical SAM protein [Thermaurantimonas sp.]